MNSSNRWFAVCKSFDRFAHALVLGLALACLPAMAAKEKSAFEPLTTVNERELPELSGLAASRRWPGVYWAHNDSGDGPRLFAFNRRGQVLARIELDGAVATDWEDIALFERDGRSWLAIGDIGDNFAFRETVSIYLLPEPELDVSRAMAQRRIEYRYPDGPRDAEGLAVDAEGGRILVAQKAASAPGFYSLPLDAGPGIQTATRLATYDALPGRRARVLVTAMDLSRDGRWLAMMSYNRLFGFRREPGEDWAQALSRAPREWRLPSKGLEAMAIEADGRSIVVAPEGVPTPVWRAKRILDP